MSEHDEMPEHLIVWTHTCVSELPDESTDDLLDAICHCASWALVARYETQLRELIERLR